MSDDIKYEYKTVHAIRGMEGRSIAKEQKEGGWELVDQSQSALRSTLNFRRAKSESLLIKALAAFKGFSPAKRRVVAAATVVVLCVAVAGVGFAAAQEKREIRSADVPGESASPAIEIPTPTPTPSPTESTAEVVTVGNNEEFAALLAAGDYCDPSMAQFAGKYRGSKIEFDGSIAHMQKHGDYKTRYDLLLAPGDAGTKATNGPAFKYDDVNMFDLELAGTDIPDFVGEDDKFRFVAEVSEYNPKSCLFFLEPVTTIVR